MIDLVFVGEQDWPAQIRKMWEAPWWPPPHYQHPYLVKPAITWDDYVVTAANEARVTLKDCALTIGGVPLDDYACSVELLPGGGDTKRKR